MNKLIDIENLTVSYDSKVVLNNANLSVFENDFIEPFFQTNRFLCHFFLNVVTIVPDGFKGK